MSIVSHSVGQRIIISSYRYQHVKSPTDIRHCLFMIRPGSGVLIFTIWFDNFWFYTLYNIYIQIFQVRYKGLFWFKSTYHQVNKKQSHHSPEMLFNYANPWCVISLPPCISSWCFFCEIRNPVKLHFPKPQINCHLLTFLFTTHNIFIYINSVVTGKSLSLDTGRWSYLWNLQISRLDSHLLSIS